MSNIILKIATPNNYTEYSKLNSVSLPAKKGMVTILPEHENLILEVNSGIIQIEDENKNFEIKISESIAYIGSNSVMIIASQSTS